MPVCGRVPDPCRDFRTESCLFLMQLEPKEHKPPTLTFNLIPFTEISPDSRKLLILCFVADGEFNFFPKLFHVFVNHLYL